MPIGSIPMPEAPGDAFLEGQAGMQNILSAMLQGRQNAQRIALAKQQEARAQELLPYLIEEQKQKAQAAQAKQQIFNKLFPQLNAQQEQQGQQQQLPQQAGQTPQVPVNAPSAKEENKAPSIVHQQLLDRLPEGQEVVVRKGSPEKAAWNEFAGQDIYGFKIPDIKSRVVDGIQYDTYPNGEVRAFKVGPSDVEKKSAQEAEAEKKIHFQTVEKQNVEDEKLTRPLVKSHRYLMEMRKILQENPKLTGPGSALALKTGFSKNSPLGKFKTLQGKLQAELGRYASQRGGIQAVSWAGSIKPDVFNQPEVNTGMIDQGIQDIEDEYGDINEDYSKRNKGKKLPLELRLNAEEGNQKKSPPGTVTMYKNGKEYYIPKDLVEQAKAEGGFSLGR